jgi:hypothetical protein
MHRMSKPVVETNGGYNRVKIKYVPAFPSTIMNYLKKVGERRGL